MKDEYVTPMDEGFRFIKIRMLTEGNATNCYYNVVLDKSLPLDYPKENWYSLTPRINVYPYQDWSKTTKPMRDKVGELDVLIVPLHSLTSYVNRLYLGNRDYKFHTSGRPFTNGTVSDIDISYYIQDRDIPYQMIAGWQDCRGSGAYLYPRPSFWVMKPGGQKTTLPILSEYHVFEIPPRVVKEITPYLNSLLTTNKEK